MVKTNSSNILILTHSQYIDQIPIYGPSDSIKDFLVNNFEGNVFFLQHSLYAGDGSILTIFNKDEKEQRCRYDFHRKFINPIRYLVDLLYTVKILRKDKFKLIIATDPLNFVYAYCLKIFTAQKVKIVFFTVDYGYKRFDSSILNWIYHSLDKFSVKNADMLWNSSYKIADVREKQGVGKDINIHIPNSPLFEVVEKKSSSEIERYSVVMVFSNYKQIDFNIVFDALSSLKDKFSDIKLKLIGRGNFEKEVLSLVKDDSILKHIQCLDPHVHRETLEILSRCAIGLECNTQTLYWNEFREPIKLREYIYFGLPIVSKPGHALVEEIKEENIGFIVKDSKEFYQAIDKLLSDEELYLKIRRNVLSVAEKYDKEKILFSEFSKLGFQMEGKN